MSTTALPKSFCKTSDYPYDRFTAAQIDSIAQKEIKKESRKLANLGLDIKFGPEIEIASQSYNLKAFNKKARRFNQAFPQWLNHLVQGEFLPHIDGDLLEVTFSPSDPLNFINGVKAFKAYYKRLAKAHDHSIDFFGLIDNTCFPSFHINFSLWEKAKNLFAPTKGPQINTNNNLLNFITNRLVRDLREAMFVFANGELSSRRIWTNRHEDSYLSSNRISAEHELDAKSGEDSIIIRDCNKEDSARIEIRKFSDNSGILSTKVLFLMKSITDSIDQLIRKFSSEVKNKKSSESLADTLEACLKNCTNDAEIRRDAQEGLIYFERDPDFRLSTIFGGESDVDGRTVTLDRFKQSPRMQKLFGTELHKKICEADLAA